MVELSELAETEFRASKLVRTLPREVQWIEEVTEAEVVVVVVEEEEEEVEEVEGEVAEVEEEEETGDMDMEEEEAEEETAAVEVAMLVVDAAGIMRGATIVIRIEVRVTIRRRGV